MRLLALLFWVLLLYLLLRPILRALWGAGSSRRPQDLPQEVLVKDPACDTYILRSEALTRRIRGREYFFCSPECAARFISDLPRLSQEIG